MSTLESFFESNLYHDLFADIKKRDFTAADGRLFTPELLTHPVVRDLKAYGEKRIGDCGAETLFKSLREQMDSLQEKHLYTALDLSIRLTDQDAYLDFMGGHIEDGEFKTREGYASGSLVTLDAVAADEGRYPELRKSRRKLHQDALDVGLKYKGESLPSSYLIHSWHLVTLSRIIAGLADHIATVPVYKDFKRTFGITESYDAYAVADWTW